MAESEATKKIDISIIIVNGYNAFLENEIGKQKQKTQSVKKQQQIHNEEQTKFRSNKFVSQACLRITFTKACTVYGINNGNINKNKNSKVVKVHNRTWMEMWNGWKCKKWCVHDTHTRHPHTQLHAHMMMMMIWKVCVYKYGLRSCEWHAAEMTKMDKRDHKRCNKCMRTKKKKN